MPKVLHAPTLLNDLKRVVKKLVSCNPWGKFPIIHYSAYQGWTTKEDCFLSGLMQYCHGALRNTGNCVLICPEPCFSKYACGPRPSELPRVTGCRKVKRQVEERTT